MGLHVMSHGVCCPDLPHQNIHNICFTPDKLNIVTGAVERDPIHSTIYRLTLNGWPERIQEVPHIAHHFWSTRDELGMEHC